MLSPLSSLPGAESLGEVVPGAAGMVPPLVVVIASYPDRSLGEGSLDARMGALAVPEP